ncbi:MAG: hypothetical protein AAF411_19575 [Myxococcota bacterium]
MSGPSPLLGYNTNVRHKGKLYHIQTEDSGVKRPHIITHLFADGGRIVASKKTSYGDIVDTGGYQDRVKQMMRDQHKAMFIGLRDGEFDEPEHGDAPTNKLMKAPSLTPPPVEDFDAAADRLAAAAPAPEPAAAPSRRYEPTRPARAPSVVPAAKAPESIFGESLLSEKSLDEVILSYLAEDLDEEGA